MPQIRPIGVSGSIPSVNQLALGDIAINTYDGKAYLKKAVGNTQTVLEIGGGSSVSSSYALSASYAANGGVTQLLAGSNISLSPSNGLGQVTISSTGGGGGTGNTATGSYGSFYSTQTQTNVASTARSMSLNVTDISNGVSISGSTSPFNTYIKVQNPGVYDIQFSAQVDKTDSGTDEIWIWIRKNGTDISDSATSIQLVGNGAHYVAAWNFFVNAAANDYFQLMWYSPDANVRLHAESAFGVVPGIPSLIVTANRVDQFLSNTGSFSGSFVGSHTGSFTGSFTGSLFGTSSNALTASFPWFQTGSNIAYVGGNVGIGTATPSFRLDISGSGRVTNNLTVTGSTVLRGPGTVTSSIALQVVNSNNSASLIVADNGNVYSYGPGFDTGSVAFGQNALLNNVNGFDFVAIGADALRTTTGGGASGGRASVAIGRRALFSMTTGANNFALGRDALRSLTTSAENIGIGNEALTSLVSGSSNISIGGDSLNSISSGSGNTAIGVEAGRRINAGTGNSKADQSIFIGNDSRANNINETNQIVIAPDGRGLGSNTTVIGNTSTTFGRWFGNLLVGTSTNAGARLQVVGSGTTTGTSLLVENSAGTDRLSIIDNGNTAFNTNHLFISGSGNVGIGTVTPSASLHISGASSSNLLRIQSPASSSILFVSGSGNIGIGTATPVYPLDVNGRARVTGTSGPVGLIDGTSYGLSVQNNAANVWIELLNSRGAGRGAFFGLDNADFQIWNYQSGSISFWTNPTSSAGTQRMTIANSGNVGIGTASPTNTLDIQSTSTGSIRISGSAGSVITLVRPTAGLTGFLRYIGSTMGIGTAGSDNLSFFTNNTSRGTFSSTGDFQVGTNLLFVSSSGNVGIGTITPTQKLDIAGAVSISGSVLDYRSATSLIAPINTTNIVSFVPGTTFAAFVDYVIKDSSTGANQRVGTIQISISLAAVSAVLNEVTTVDIGNTSAISFNVSYGAPTWLTATNSGATAYDIRYIIRYF